MEPGPVRKLVNESEPILKSGSIPHLSLHHHETGDSRATAQVEIVEEFIHEDAEKLRGSFKMAFDKMHTELKKPHVLIAGTAGAGKR